MHAYHGALVIRAFMSASLAQTARVLTARIALTARMLRGAVLRRPSGPFRRPAAADRAPLQGVELTGGSTGPLVEGGTRDGFARRQYCWWITFSHPFEDTVAQQQLRTPSSFDRKTFFDFYDQQRRSKKSTRFAHAL